MDPPREPDPRTVVKRCPTCSRVYDTSATFCAEDGQPLELDQVSDPLIGREIQGRFRIDEKLGAGGMGAIYRATQLSVDRPVVIKVLHQHLVAETVAVKRFLVEARAVSRLTNPHTVTLFDFGQTRDGMLFMVIELLEGLDLRAKLERQGALDLDETARILLDVAESLSEAHAHEILHRDLKPANVFLARTSEQEAFVKVLDFGIARASKLAGTTTITSTGMVAGTPVYMAPETALGQPQDASVDVYALGVMMYEMLAGRPPYQGETALEVMMKHLQAEPPPLSEVGLRAPLPRPVERFLWRCLAKNRTLRPADARAFRAELSAALEAPEDPVDRPRQLHRTSDQFQFDPAEVMTTTALAAIPSDVGDGSWELPRPIATAGSEDPRGSSPRRGRLAAVAAAAVLAVAAWAGVAVWALSGPPDDGPRGGDGERAGGSQPTATEPGDRPSEPGAAEDDEGAPPEPPEPVLATLEVTSEPPGAMVHVGDEARRAPATFRVTQGAAVDVRCEREGHESWSRTVTVEGDPLTERCVLSPLAAVVTVTSSPKKVTVKTPAGEILGSTPHEIRTHIGAEVDVRCTKSGYRSDRLTVQVDAVTIEKVCRLRKKVTRKEHPESAGEHDMP